MFSRPGFHKFIQARLSPEGEFGLHLTIGVAVLMLATWGFGLIADQVVDAGHVVAVDAQAARWFHAHASSNAGLTRLVLWFTDVHSIAGAGLLSAALGWYFFRRRARYWLLTLAVAVPGGMLLNVLLKSVFMRARPIFDDPIITLATYSFPSGHTAASTMFYGILAAYLLCQRPRWGARVAIVAGAVAMVLLVGVSRMYLGAHYFSDVLAAVAESCAWLAVCLSAGSTIRRRRAARATV